MNGNLQTFPLINSHCIETLKPSCNDLASMYICKTNVNSHADTDINAEIVCPTITY